MSEKVEKESVNSQGVIETSKDIDVKGGDDSHEERIEPTEEDWKNLREVLYNIYLD